MKRFLLILMLVSSICLVFANNTVEEFGVTKGNLKTVNSPIISKDGDVLYQQTNNLPDDEFIASRVSDDFGVAQCYESFSGVNGEIYSVKFYGNNASYSQEAGWVDGDEDPMLLKIYFFEDDNGTYGEEVAVREASLSRTHVYDNPIGMTGYFWQMDFDQPVTLSEGWISIRGALETDPDSHFLWLSSSEGDGDAIMNYDGTDYETGFDLNMILMGNAGETFNVSGVLENSENDEAIAGASVELGSNLTTSDDSGNFAFDVNPGTYTLTVSADGYEEYTQNEINVVSDDINLGTISLNPIQEELLAPENLTADLDTDYGIVYLEWSAPGNGGGEGGTESFEEAVPPAGWEVIQTNTVEGCFWSQFAVVEYPDGNVEPTDGEYQAGVKWDYGQQDEWLITEEFTAAGNLTFDFYGHYGSTNGDNYYVKVSDDGGENWTAVWNATDLPEADNHYDEPVTIDLTDYSGQDIKLAWHFVDGDGQGLWYATFIDNIVIGSGKNIVKFEADELINVSHSTVTKSRAAHTLKRDADEPAYMPLKTRELLGYNLYRNDNLVAQMITENSSSDDVTDMDGQALTYYVTAVYTAGESDASNEVVIDPVNGEDVVNVVKLEGNYPNPFNPVTKIEFSNTENSHIKIDIYNVKGQKVKTLVNDDYEAGKHSVVWNGKDDNNQAVASGVYFYKMKNGKYTAAKKMILMK